MEFKDVLEARYSVRKFSDAPVEQEKLDKVLEAGRICPTATNAQPQRIFVLRDAESFTKLGKAARMRYGAPIVLLVCADGDTAWKGADVEPGYDAGTMDASIATTYMMLQATDLGLGTIWIRYMNAREIKENFALPESLTPICLMPLGYRADDCEPAPRHYQRKPIEEIVKYL